jgi:hypothetical protein
LSIKSHTTREIHSFLFYVDEGIKRERFFFMIKVVKNLPSEQCTPDYIEKLSKFRDVDTDVLTSLYNDIARSHRAILKALETASSTQAFYFSVDARNCEKTMNEIKGVLFLRGVREFVNEV